MDFSGNRNPQKLRHRSGLVPVELHRLAPNEGQSDIATCFIISRQNLEQIHIRQIDPFVLCRFDELHSASINEKGLRFPPCTGTKGPFLLVA